MVGFPARPRLLVVTMVCAALTALTALTAACSTAGGDAAPAPPPHTQVTDRAGALPPTQVSADRRALADENGTRFVWVADTAWLLTQKLTREEIDEYLDRRAAQGFTVVMMVAVAGRDGTFARTANAAGDLPFDGDFGSVSATDGGYWAHVDYAVRAAQQRGLTVALLPAWSQAHAGVTLRAEHGRRYGRFLAQRLRDQQAKPVVWVMGGDDTEPHTDVWREVLAGIRETGDRGLVSYHPAGWSSSLGRLEGADFVMIQSSHCTGVQNGYPTLLESTIAQAGQLPVVDAEPLYEEHPWCWEPSRGYSTTAQVRAQLWWSVFAGGFGASYGHHSVWQFYDGTDGINAPRPTWREVLDAPVAQQMRHLRTFLAGESDDPLRPDAALVRGQGQGWSRALAMRSQSGRRVTVYVPRPTTVGIDPARLAGDRSAVSWFSPRTGETVAAGEAGPEGLAGLTPPTSGDEDDWVLDVRSAD